MNYYELLKENAAGKGSEVMWKAVKQVSDVIQPMKHSDPETYWRLMKDTYADMCGKHFNDKFGEWQIEQMYYADKKGDKHYAPYWATETVVSLFEANKHKLHNPEYTAWDFVVTMNMMKSDNCGMIREWFPEITEDEMNKKLVEMSINYLNDPDSPHAGHKIWSYYND